MTSDSEWNKFCLSSFLISLPITAAQLSTLDYTLFIETRVKAMFYSLDQENTLFLLKNGPFPASFSLFLFFQNSWQYIGNTKYADDWIQTWDLWC